MKKILFYGFPVVIKAVFTVVAAGFVVLAVMNPEYAAYYGVMAVLSAVAAWICPTMGRLVSAQEVWDNTPVEKILTRDVSSKELDHALRRQLARAITDGDNATAEEIVKTYKFWKEQGAPSLSGIHPSALK